MTSLKVALYLTCLCFWRGPFTSTLKMSSSFRQEEDFISANVGGSVKLRCFYEDDTATMFYWFKQALGQKPRLISSFYKHLQNGTFTDEFMDTRRFTLETKKGENHLTILSLRTSDSATYYCVRSYSYKFEFAEGTVVSVKGSDSNILALVHQSASETVQPEGSETLNCTVHTGSCDGEHSVYWFKNSQGSHPGLIYTQGGKNYQCEREANTQTHSCVYNLPLKSLNVSHAGTYYCAVASCGHILFGNGTTLDFVHEVNSPDYLVYFLSGALAFTTVLVVLLAFVVHKMNKGKNCQCTESQRVSASSTTNGKGDRDADNLHYAALRDYKAHRSSRQRDNTNPECVYSSVRQ